MQHDDTPEQDKEIESHNDGTLIPVRLCDEPRSHRLRVISTRVSGKCSLKPDRVATDMIVLFICPLALLAVEHCGVFMNLLDTRLFLLDTVAAGHPISYSWISICFSWTPVYGLWTPNCCT